MKRQVRFILILFLSINILNSISCQEVNRDRTLILRKAYYEFELGFKRKYEDKNREKHLMNSKELLIKAIKNYPDGWENIIERVYLATIEYQLGNKDKAREEFKKIYSSPFSYDLKTIYSDNEIGLTWYLIKELHINPNYCEEFKKTQRLFLFQDYMKYYEYKNDIYEYWQNNPHSSNCGGGPYKNEDVIRDLISVYYCNGNHERAIELIKKSRNKYLNLQTNDLPEEVDVFVRIIKNKYSKEEINAEWSKSISSMQFKKSHWNILLFDNRIALSDKIKKEEKVLELSKETSSQNIRDLLSQTELFKRLIE